MIRVCVHVRSKIKISLSQCLLNLKITSDHYSTNTSDEHKHKRKRFFYNVLTSCHIMLVLSMHVCVIINILKICKSCVTFCIMNTVSLVLNTHLYTFTTMSGDQLGWFRDGYNRYIARRNRRFLFYLISWTRVFLLNLLMTKDFKHFLCDRSWNKTLRSGINTCA